ncbi:ABC transporter ATP-binding protein [Microcella sp.]|uniref:ABC transporter ATP-binding protein n=1 Tax=Microcella sp. TaxID=1913979 RepID=UPI00256695CF|nr:ATP-binding cassette domain-containing protein [Microcella sp.]MBX9472391.1 ATP-binding cassette domain-containing protein [Microcella sp.]
MNLPSTIAPVLSIQNITVTFGGTKAVNDFSGHVNPGEIVGLIGPNGAGKSTVINAVSGFVPQSGGAILLDGIDLTRETIFGRSRMGLGRAFQRVAFATGITAREHLSVAALHGKLLRRRVLEPVHMQLVRSAGLEEHLDVPVDQLSFLYRRLVGIVMAVIGGDRVVMLDEATAGLTDGERRRIGDMIMAWAVEHNRGFLVVEHDLEFVRQISTRTIVMDKGAVLADGETDAVLRDPAVVTAYMGN